MAIAAPIGSVKTVVTGVTSTTLAYSPNPTQGNCLTAFQSQYSGGSNPTINTPTDNAHTYSAAIAQLDSTGKQAIRAYYVLNCAGGARTVTFSGDVNCVDLTCVLAEWSGVAQAGALDQTGTKAATGTAASANSGVTVQNDEVSIGVLTYDGTTTTITPTQTQIQENENNSTAASIGVEYRIETTTGAKTLNWTLGASRAYVAFIFTLKAELPGQPTMRRHGGVYGGSRVLGAEGVQVF